MNTLSPAAPTRSAALRPLIIDAVLPLGAYYLLTYLGLSTLDALAISSVVPLVRTVTGIVRDRSVNVLAAVILLVNLAGIALTFLTGDPRLMLAKEGAVSSLVGLAMLGSLLVGKPLMSMAVKPMLGGRDARYLPAFDRLSATSPRFRALERGYTAAWGVLLLAECAVRVFGVFTLPVSTMVWLSHVLVLVAIALGVFLAGRLFLPEMKRMLDTEVGR